MELLSNKKDCCGCEACKNICPQSAITMNKDKKGFFYPEIIADRCIDCGLCKNICPLQDETFIENKELKAYALANKNKEQLLKSSSGGAFSAMAQYVIENGGVAAGCAWGDNAKPEHIIITKTEDITKLQGSKYVQSEMGDIYSQIKRYLDEKTTVLFSGTPCQCDALRKYLRKDYDNLICAELICHGVPSAQFFKDYISTIPDLDRIIDVDFRNKKYGWGLNLKLLYKSKSGRVHTKYMSAGESYYYSYFKEGLIYREACYNCRYANLNRQSDLTIGDFWGINKDKYDIDISGGVSLVITNGCKGEAFLHKLAKDYIQLFPSDIEPAIKENGQLMKPTEFNQKSDTIWDIYFKSGAIGLDKHYRLENRKKILIGKIKRNMPQGLKNMIHKFYK